MQNEPIFLSAEKKVILEQELEELQSVKRKEIIEALEYSKSLGDLSENAEYHQAREDQGRLEDRVREIENILQNATIIKKSRVKGTVSVGSSVVVCKKGTKIDKEFEIVGAEEADSSIGKISSKSPLGEALLGKQKGESVKIETPKGNVTYDILDVS